MKVCVTGCTHSQHFGISWEQSADLLIHTGDIGGRTGYLEMKQFIDWIGKQPFKYKIFIAGNHDMVLEDFKPINLPKGVFYLHDEGINIEGKDFYGSPYTPEFFNWHFMKKRGEEMKRHWDSLPSGLDVLITHGPPHTILDNVERKMVGDAELLEAVTRTQPKFHVFSHIHEGYGQKTWNNTTFINASHMDEFYRPNNKPIYFTI